MAYFIKQGLIIFFAFFSWGVSHKLYDVKIRANVQKKIFWKRNGENENETDEEMKNSW